MKSNPVNEDVIAEFRANGGQVGGSFEGSRLLLLTTRGARTGRPRTTPLMYLPDGDRLVVFASNGGSAHSPGWCHNLIHWPHATVEVGRDRYEARAVFLDDTEHDELWRRQDAAEPGFAQFRGAATRTIPLIGLVRTE